MTPEELITLSAQTVANTALASVTNAAKSVFNSSPVGQTLNKLGIPLFQGQFGPQLDPASWAARAQSRPDPLVHIDWDIEMPDGFDSANVEEIQASMADFAVSDGVFRAGTRQYYAETEDIGALSITFYEDRLLTTTQYIKGWRARIANPDGTRNYPSVYKRTIKVWPMDAKGNRLAEFKYKGCWPSKIPSIAWGSQGTTRITHQVDFSVDSLDIVVFSGSQNGAGDNPVFGSIQDFMQGLPIRLLGTATNAANKAIVSAVGNAAKQAAGKLFF